MGMRHPGGKAEQAQGMWGAVTPPSHTGSVSAGRVRACRQPVGDRGMAATSTEVHGRRGGGPRPPLPVQQL